MSGLQTEYEFFLPKGFVDDDGEVHRAGVMRLATARDELEPLRDPRVRDADDPFLTIIVLSRVISKLGSLKQVTPRDVENLFAADLAYLQDVYGAINFGGPADIAQVTEDATRRKREAARPAAATPPASASSPAGAGAGAAKPTRMRPAAKPTKATKATKAVKGAAAAASAIDARKLAAELQARFGDASDESDDDEAYDELIDEVELDGSDALGESDDESDDLDEVLPPRRRRIEEIGTRVG